MSKPSTDTITELHVRKPSTELHVYVWRRYKRLPRYLTLRFLALLRPAELERLERRYAAALAKTTGPARTMHARLRRIQSGIRERSYTF